MPRRERDRELARRRKRLKERRREKNKGLMAKSAGKVKEVAKKKPEKIVVKETPKEDVEKTPSAG